MRYIKQKPDYTYNHITDASDEFAIKKIFDRAYTKALRYLAPRPRSTKEIYDYLKQKEFDETIIEKILELLTKQKFLNDLEFATWWIRGRQHSRARGKQIIQMELRAKGINEHHIHEAFGLEGQDDLKTAKEYYEKKKSRFEKYAEPERFQKAAAFLQRRGFSWDIVKQVLNNSND